MNAELFPSALHDTSGDHGMPAPRKAVDLLKSFRRHAVASITRRYPFYTGCGTAGNCRLVRMLAGRHVGAEWVHLRQGPWLRVMMGDYLSNSVFYTREWDRKISWVCERLLRPGDTAMDIGANIGLVSCQMASLVGPGGAVHSFEPNPGLVALLSESAARNRYKHIHIHPFALGEREEELELTFPPDNQCLATLTRHRNGKSVRVPVRTLSNWWPESGIRSLRLMKIDVEGFEPQVFRGAASVFGALRPDAILFELNDYTGVFEQHPTIQFLKSFGYEFLMLPKRMLGMRAERFSGGALTGSPSNDLIAAPAGRVFEDIARSLRA